MIFDFLNGSTSWLGALGLTIEIGGLSFLFVDLLKSKQSDRTADALDSFAKSLASSRNQSTVALHGAFKSLSQSAVQILTIQSDKTVPSEVRQALLQKFMEAESLLLSTDKISAAQAAEAVAEAEIVRLFESQTTASLRLLKIARSGIALVLLGASMQLLDVAAF